MAHGIPPAGTAPAHHLRPGIHRAPLAQRPNVGRVPADEAIYGLYRRHPYVFVRGLRLPVVLVLLAGLAAGALNAIAPSDLPGWLASLLGAGNLVFLAVIAIAAIWAVYTWLDWRDDYLLISERRVIVQVASPGVRTLLREVPMGKVQNVITHHAHLSQILLKLLHVGELVIDTAGLGQIHFENISEEAAQHAQEVILDLQKGVRAASQVPREQYRREYVHSIVTGATPPAQPRTIVIPSYPRTGYTFLNYILPRHPWREGQQVIWHTHWWFLIKAELVPLAILVLFELTNLAAAAVGAMLHLDSNPLLDAIGFIRPFLLIGLLPVVAWIWEDWRNDQYIVDKDSLISRSTLPFGLAETVKQTEVRRVVDATVNVDGVIPKLLGFGDVVMKTPGEATEFLFAGVHRPFDVHQEIMNRLDAQREQEQVQWDRDIQEWLRAYVEERRAEPTPAPPPQAPEWWF